MPGPPGTRKPQSVSVTAAVRKTDADHRAPQGEEGRQGVLGTLLGQEGQERWEEWANRRRGVWGGRPREGKGPAHVKSKRSTAPQKHKAGLGWMRQRAKGRPRGRDRGTSPSSGTPTASELAHRHLMQQRRASSRGTRQVRVRERAPAARCAWPGGPKGARGSTPQRTESRASNRRCAGTPLPVATLVTAAKRREQPGGPLADGG